MKLIIPMSGYGKRFLKAGYDVPKPLLKVDGKHIIEHVIDMFPEENDVIFICNKEHIKTTNIKEILVKIKPSSKIITIDGHDKGPVHSLNLISDEIDDNEEIIVNYCDFNVGWDYQKIKKQIADTKCDGAIPCYTGFHPHLIHKKLYAGILADNDFMIDIREKHSFTQNPMDSYHSSGTYYFRSWKQMKNYCRELEEKNINLNGEFYVSMIYYLYKRDNKRIYIPKIEHFIQWGTPEDLEEYESWSRHFAKLSGNNKGETTTPVARKPEYKIMLNPGSENYTKSFEYWKSYFSKCNHHPYGK